MTVRDDLAAEPDRRKRARIQAQAFAALPANGLTITRGRWSLVVTRSEMDGDRVRFYVRVERDGVDATPPELRDPEFVRFTAPPVFVQDPAGDDVVETFVRDPATRQPVRVQVRRRWDPDAVLRRELRDVLIGVTRGR